MGFDTYINAPESLLAKVTYYLTYKKFFCLPEKYFLSQMEKNDSYPTYQPPFRKKIFTIRQKIHNFGGKTKHSVL